MGKNSRLYTPDNVLRVRTGTDQARGSSEPVCGMRSGNAGGVHGVPAVQDEARSGRVMTKLESPVEQTKKCAVCGKSKPATNEYFYRHKFCVDGLRSQCILCCKLRSNKAYERKSKLVNYNAQSYEIYRTYYHTNCDTDVKRQMLAKFYGITVSELNQIIIMEDEKLMYIKWTDKKNAELLANASLPGATKETLATTYGTTARNIENRILKLRKAQTPVSDPTPLEVLDPVNTYSDCAPDDTLPRTPIINDVDPNNPPYPVDYAPPTALRMDPDKAVNVKIGQLCETPEPQHKPDYTESLLETLRESIEVERAASNINYYKSVDTEEKLSDAEMEIRDLRMTVDQQAKTIDMLKSAGTSTDTLAKSNQSIYDRAHTIISIIEVMAEQQEIDVSRIRLMVDTTEIDASVSNARGECVGWHKNNQPTGSAAD